MNMICVKYLTVLDIFKGGNMKPTAEDFYQLISNQGFKNILDIIHEGFTGMFFVLKKLAEGKTDMSAGDIADSFGVSTARTAVVLKNLENKGFVIKSKAEDDGRKTLVKISKNGTIALKDRMKNLLMSMENLLLKLSGEETTQLYNILQKLLVVNS